ncbi:unnamed protein product [Darwinula stevensoni]|uniref:Nucleolar protein 4 helical domain-containing protein n=1 Tax=Darwinula stevensoni TaxID=69355 RepID=A0A7R8WXP1_9CRUS|nr:unnamed protein product [Darwinula stevensoni]CAG0878637.1 unnamed protein product [Darwinula stevensoni]
MWLSFLALPFFSPEPIPSLGKPTSKDYPNGPVQYKKVAVVEEFFEIIYNIHVEIEGRHGKHAGQKRTYKAVSEQYAFLPREAVTKFLAMCMDCRRKRSGKSSEDSSTPNSVSPEHYAVDVNRNELDFSIPITSAYLKQAGNHHVPDTDGSFEGDELRGSEGEGGEEGEGECPRSPGDVRGALDLSRSGSGPCRDFTTSPRARTSTSIRLSPINMLNGKESPLPIGGQMASSPARSEGSCSLVSGPCADADVIFPAPRESDCLSSMSQMENMQRRKTFGAYVRKIVDESLDRMLPISRQPPEKINVLVEQCQQLYPEFIHEARNRIRSYLKSCRRNKKIRELEHIQTNVVGADEPASTTSSKRKLVGDDGKGKGARKVKVEEERDADKPSPVIHSLDKKEEMDVDGEGKGERGRGRLDSLTPAEKAHLEQIISCYRQSAAYLLSSANRLEGLIQS